MMQRKLPRRADDEEALTEDIVALARQYSRYGYRRVTALLRDAGWTANRKQVERIWRREGLKVPQKQPKRGRLWLNDGSCVRLRPEHPGHVWAYDFVARQLKHEDVLAALTDPPVARRPSANIRSDNGSELELQRVASRRVDQRRDLLQPRRIKSADQNLAAALQYRPPPHSSLSYRPPAPEAASPPMPPSGSPSLHLQAAMATEAKMN
jgi:putative transposase